ncbi:MAG: hypothetical protein HGB18_01555 [Candidatus Moranbacteria bacterium]|nr:hypothetical protein [Candidatus Moranbacteria bacterium]
MIFENRTDAGRQLASSIVAAGEASETTNTIVVGLARGGIVVAKEVASLLDVPLYSFSVDDCRIPSQEIEGGEVAVFLTGFGTATVWKTGAFEPETFFRDAEDASLANPIVLNCRKNVASQHAIFGGMIPEDVIGKRVMLIDDGAVTGRSIIAAINAMEYAGASQIVIGIPAILNWFPDIINGHRVVSCRRSRSDYFPTGMFYDSFEDTRDNEVLQALGRVSVDASR